MVNNPPGDSGDTETGARSLGQEDPLEEEMATHSSILAWRIPRIEEPSGPQSMGVTENWTRLSEHTHMVVASPGSEPEGRNPCG